MMLNPSENRNVSLLRQVGFVVATVFLLTIVHLMGFALGARLAGVQVRQAPRAEETVERSDEENPSATDADDVVTQPQESGPSQAQQLRLMWLVILVCLANTLVMGWWITKLSLPPAAMAGLVTIVFLSCLTLMPQIETWFFLRNPYRIVTLALTMGVCVSVPFGLCAAWRFHQWSRITGKEPIAAARWSSLVRPGIRGVACRVAFCVLAYVGLYLVFGYFVAWQHPQLRVFYGGDPETPPSFWTLVSTAPVATQVIPLQCVRGLLWTALVWVMIRCVRGSRYAVAISVALVLAIVMNAQLLLPNPVLARDIRIVHLIETALTNFIFGLICVAVWSTAARGDDAHEPVKVASRPG